MADDTTFLNAKDLLETPQKAPNFLNSEDIEMQEAQRDDAPIPSRREAVPGRRPLFRS
jgi:hypothetical protein